MSSIVIYNGRDLVGDAIQKLPFLRAVRALFPEHCITWLTSEDTAYATVLSPLTEGLLDEVSVRPDLLHSKWEILRGSPVRERYDILIDTQNSLWRSLALRRIRHGLYISSTARFLLSDRRPGWPFDKPANLVHRLLLLAELAAGRPARFDGVRLPVPIELVRRAAQALPDGPRYLGLAPGAGRRIKCWPLERFIEVARWHAARGGVPVFLIGPAELEWQPEVRDAVPEALFPLQDDAFTEGELSPIKTIALSGRLTAAVTNDSGVGHMLAAADIPLLTLFGPTNSEKFRPIISRGEVMSAQARGSEDMAAITTDEVIERAAVLLQS